MKRILSVLALSLFVTSVSLASFPVKNSKENTTVVTKESTNDKSVTLTKEEKKANKVKARIEKKAMKADAKAAKKAAKAAGDDTTIAIILALVSVLLLPFAFHNWYLGRTKIALWQTLMVFPGIILLGIPALISWIWQIVDLVRLLVNGELPK